MELVATDAGAVARVAAHGGIRRYPERMVRRVKRATTEMSASRLEAYTDGVFAIAATLLVLDLTTHTIGEVSSDAELWGGLRAMWPSVFGFIISFGLLSVLWVVHVQQFNELARVDEPMMWINNVRLLFIVFMPFTTSLASDYSDYFAGRMLLPINFFLASLCAFVAWSWACARDGHLLKPQPSGAVAHARREGLIALGCAAFAMVASPWIGSLGFLVYTLLPLAAALGRKRSAQDAGG